ncbi:MAG TPA: redox-sensing transcriptional repressor Rex [Bacteroidales bacterium]|nr:redox-sensing transcriptional repressor Rex [Bacteroidales bacterium]
MKKAGLPEKTLERLLGYRRVLLQYQYLQYGFIFSHNLARLARTSAANVRRDLMLLGAEGDVHKGYAIQSMLRLIDQALDFSQVQNMCFVGMGEPGLALYESFLEPGTALALKAQFFLGRNEHSLSSVPAYNITEMPRVIREENIRIAVLAVSREYAREITTLMVNAGIVGILNFTPLVLQVPAHVVVENFDLNTKLQKIGYYIRRVQR